MEKTIIMDAAGAPRMAPRARRPYGAPALEAVDLGRVLADEFVYQSNTADNLYDSSNLFGSSSS